jgi:hypothetical protein
MRRSYHHDGDLRSDGVDSRAGIHVAQSRRWSTQANRADRNLDHISARARGVGLHGRILNRTATRPRLFRFLLGVRRTRLRFFSHTFSGDEELLFASAEVAGMTLPSPRSGYNFSPGPEVSRLATLSLAALRQPLTEAANNLIAAVPNRDSTSRNFTLTPRNFV